MTLLEELAARGLVADVTDRAALDALLASGPVKFYAGFDPSGPSLHVGSLLPVALLRALTAAGHRPIAVVGGATGMIGDPSGKSQERRLLDVDTLARNVASLSAQLAHLLPGVTVVDNATWTGNLSYIDFLRDVGKHITVNYMLAKESVRARLEDREQGISYTEFSYMLLQAYDFAHLARTAECRLQIGGSDQWGNITCGIELTRRLGGPEVFGLTHPLLMTQAGTKFGKSEAGTSVWVDPHATSPYRFYQFWINIDDADVGKYLRMFTSLPLAEIDRVLGEHETNRAQRVAQKRLAAELTTWVHGAFACARAEKASMVMFGGALGDLSDADLEPLLEDVPSHELPRAELAAGVSLVDLLTMRTGNKLLTSKSEARRQLTQGGVYVNNARVVEDRLVSTNDLATRSMLVLRAGKKKYLLVRVT